MERIFSMDFSDAISTEGKFIQKKVEKKRMISNLVRYILSIFCVKYFQRFIDTLTQMEKKNGLNYSVYLLAAKTVKGFSSTMNIVEEQYGKYSSCFFSTSYFSAHSKGLVSLSTG